jgi:hypothetical protein
MKQGRDVKGMKQGRDVKGMKQGRDVSRICGFVHATVGTHSL